MNQTPSNTPLMDSPPGPAGWLPVWIKAVSQPNEQTFIAITEQPDATSRTAFIWVFIAGTISGIVQSILRTIILATGGVPQMPIPGLEQFSQQPVGGDASSIGISLVTGLCLSPVAGLISILFFAIFTAITQWVAKLFGGSGTFEKLAYGLAAVTVPFTLVSSVLTLVSAIPYVNICTGILSFGLGIYALVLEIMAVKAVNRFGWGAATGSILLPAFAIAFFCACLIVAGAALLAPVIGNVFGQGMPSFSP